jgi:hypothetical protein
MDDTLYAKAQALRTRIEALQEEMAELEDNLDDGTPEHAAAGRAWLALESAYTHLTIFT